MKNCNELKAEYKQKISEQIQQLTQLKEEYRQAQQLEADEEELNRLKGQIDFLGTKINGNINIGIDNPFHWFIEFNRIMENGGFDIIMGNPPYVEYERKNQEGVRPSTLYEIKNYRTKKCSNLYAYFVERSYRLGQSESRLGFIIPLSGISTDRMTPLQQVLVSKSETIHLSHFSGDRNPAELFDGVKLRATIMIATVNGNKGSRIFSSKYMKFYTKERPDLFAKLEYHDVSRLVKDGTIPKIHNQLETNILYKISSNSQPISSYFGTGSHSFFYYNTPIFWVKAFTFKPYFWNQRDGEKLSTQIRHVGTKNEKVRDVIVGLLNSSLFFWFWIVHSDVYHLNIRELNMFKVDVEQMEEDNLKELRFNIQNLMRSYQNNSVMKTVNYSSTGLVKYQEIDPKTSKATIDEIDRSFAKHYNFTNDEYEYIINFDLKFRLGLGA